MVLPQGQEVRKCTLFENTLREAAYVDSKYSQA